MIDTLIHHLTKEIINSIVIIFFTFSIIVSSSYFISKQEWTKIKKKKYLSFIRNLALVFSIVFLFFIWRGEIKTFILSISAITVGLFVVFKDVILSFFSYFIISSNQLLTIGDVVEIDDKVGKVTDRTLLFTKISLIGPNHGKELIIPNNSFSSGKFINLSTNSVYSKSFNLLIENFEVQEKIEYLNNVLSEEFKDTKCISEIYIENNTAREISIKILIKNIEENFDFNSFKNKIYINFFNKYPMLLSEIQ